MSQSTKAVSNSDYQTTTHQKTRSHYDGNVAWKITRWQKRIAMRSQYPLRRLITSHLHNSPHLGALNRLPTCRHITTTTKHYDAEYSMVPSPPRPPTAEQPQALEPRATANTSSAPGRGPTRRSDYPTEHWNLLSRSAISRQPCEVRPETSTSLPVLTKHHSSAPSSLPKQGTS